MDTITVCFSWIAPHKADGLTLPSYETELASGMDVRAVLDESVVLAPGDIRLVPCGFAVAVPKGYEIQVRPRSGLAVKHGITLINAPGTIDADYRGEVKVALINLGQASFTVRRGDRIAQLVLAPVARATLRAVDSLDQTLRGDGGFGHTGVS